MVHEVKESKYPRLSISVKTHLRVQKIAKKKALLLSDLGEKIAVAGIKALGL